jgi:hypothetical protein
VVHLADRQSKESSTDTRGLMPGLSRLGEKVIVKQPKRQGGGGGSASSPGHSCSSCLGCGSQGGQIGGGGTSQEQQQVSAWRGSGLVARLAPAAAPCFTSTSAQIQTKETAASMWIYVELVPRMIW